MNPRHKTSIKWTAFPKELLTQIKSVFEENFAEHLGSARLIVEGRIYPKELLFRVGYLEEMRLRQANFEVSLDFDATKENAVKQIHTAVDCAASMMQEYFDGEKDLLPFPKLWFPYEVNDKKVYLQVSAENTELEAEANKLLGAESEDLVKDDDSIDDESREAVISMLGLGGAEDEETEDSESETPKKSPKKSAHKKAKTKTRKH